VAGQSNEKNSMSPLGTVNLLRDLSPVVQPGCRFDEYVLHARSLWNLGLCSSPSVHVFNAALNNLSDSENNSRLSRP
jgi:hypothetical protein